MNNYSLVKMFFELATFVDTADSFSKAEKHIVLVNKFKFNSLLKFLYFNFQSGARWPIDYSF